MIVTGVLELDFPVYDVNCNYSSAISAFVRVYAQMRRKNEFYEVCKYNFDSMGVKILDFMEIEELHGECSNNFDPVETHWIEVAKSTGMLTMNDVNVVSDTAHDIFLASPIHEKAFAISFVKKEYRKRLLELFCKRAITARRSIRYKLLGQLSHRLFDMVNLSVVIEDVSKLDFLETCARLRELGALNYCYVISTNPDWDGQYWFLDDILELSQGYADVIIISCLPGHLVYLEQEEKNNRIIASRKLKTEFKDVEKRLR